MKEVPLINTCWLKPFAEYFGKRGVGLEPYCAAAQIELVQITSGSGWITKHQLYLFLEALAKGEKMPEVGFVVGELITPDYLGDLGKAMAKAGTLGEVIRTFCDLINRHVEGNHCHLEEGAEGEVWFFNAKDPIPVPGQAIADQAGLMSMVNLVRLVGGREWYPDKACLQTAPTNAYRKVPGLKDCEFTFEQEASGFAFPAKWLLCSTKEAIQLQDEEPPGKGLLQGGEPIAEKIEILLNEIMGVGGICPTVKLMADLCNTSTRTLHRQLQQAGTNYKGILDRVRYEQACAQLRDSEISVKELAYRLGYSGSNNFIRCFKRLSGGTPSAYRTEAREGATAP